MKQAEDTKTKDLLAKSHRGPYVKLPRALGKRTFGDFIVMRRQLRHMTQAQYAGSVNISRRSLINIEQMRERPRWTYIGAIWQLARYEFRSWEGMISAFGRWEEEEISRNVHAADLEARNVQPSDAGLAVCTIGAGA